MSPYAICCLIARATALSTTPTMQLSRREWVAGTLATLLTVPEASRGVVANPFEEIDATARAQLNESVPVLDLDAAIDLIRRKSIVSVEFLTAVGDTALARLADGSNVYIYCPENPSTSRGPLTFVSKLRDARVPYKFTAYNLQAFSASKKSREAETPSLRIQAELREQQAMRTPTPPSP